MTLILQRSTHDGSRIHRATSRLDTSQCGHISMAHSQGWTIQDIDIAMIPYHRLCRACFQIRPPTHSSIDSLSSIRVVRVFPFAADPVHQQWEILAADGMSFAIGERGALMTLHERWGVIQRIMEWAIDDTTGLLMHPSASGWVPYWMLGD